MMKTRRVDIIWTPQLSRVSLKMLVQRETEVRETRLLLQWIEKNLLQRKEKGIKVIKMIRYMKV